MLCTNNVCKLVILTLAFLSITGCSFLRGPERRFDTEKRQFFESHFQQGMDRSEVENILQDINGEVVLLREEELRDGDILLRYQTKRSLSGEAYYMFRFSPDGYLITLFPPNA
jgi:hypothetical protein